MEGLKIQWESLNQLYFREDFVTGHDSQEIYSQGHRCPVASCCHLLKSTISCELLQAEGLPTEMHYYKDGHASLYGSLTTFWQSRTNVVATMNDFSAKHLRVVAGL